MSSIWESFSATPAQGLVAGAMQVAGGEDIERGLQLSPQEKRIVEYHRSNLANPGRDEEGRPVTVFSTGITVREGPFKGKFVAVPGFVDGKVITDEGQLWERWKDDINAGKWPIYESGEQLNLRSQDIHNIMDAEAQ